MIDVEIWANLLSRHMQAAAHRGRATFLSHCLTVPEGSILYLTLQFSSSRLVGGSTNSILLRASVRNLLYLYGASERAFWVKMKDPATNSPSRHCPTGKRNVKQISRTDILSFIFTLDILVSENTVCGHYLLFFMLLLNWSCFMTKQPELREWVRLKYILTLDFTPVAFSPVAGRAEEFPGRVLDFLVGKGWLTVCLCGPLCSAA